MSAQFFHHSDILLTSIPPSFFVRIIVVIISGNTLTYLKIVTVFFWSSGLEHQGLGVMYRGKVAQIPCTMLQQEEYPL